MKIMANRIKEMRLQRGFTQEELGKLINVTKTSISCYESGSRIPNVETLKDLANALGVTVNYLLGQEINVLREDDTSYNIYMSSIELKILSELKKYPKLYSNLVDNTENTIALLNKKI